MMKKRSLILLICALIFLSAVTWGPMFWSDENTFSDGNAFIRRWSKIALYLYIPWALLLLFSTISLVIYLKNKWIKIGVAVSTAIVLVFVISIGPLIHVCALGIDCI